MDVDCAIIININPFAVVALDDNPQLGPSVSRRSSLNAASYKDLTLDQAAQLIRVWLCTSFSPHILFRQLEKEPVFHADKQETRLNSIGVCLKLRTAIAAAGAESRSQRRATSIHSRCLLSCADATCFERKNVLLSQLRAAAPSGIHCSAAMMRYARSQSSITRSNVEAKRASCASTNAVHSGPALLIHACPMLCSKSK